MDFWEGTILESMTDLSNLRLIERHDKTFKSIDSELSFYIDKNQQIVGLFYSSMCIPLWVTDLKCTPASVAFKIPFIVSGITSTGILSKYAKLKSLSNNRLLFMFSKKRKGSLGLFQGNLVYYYASICKTNSIIQFDTASLTPSIQLFLENPTICRFILSKYGNLCIKGLNRVALNDTTYTVANCKDGYYMLDESTLEFTEASDTVLAKLELVKGL